MAKSLFHRNQPEKSAPTPHDLIENEVQHLKKGSSTRYGAKGKPWSPPWIVIFILLGLVWLFIMDPILHAWYKGESVRTYLYLKNFGSAKDLDSLVACQILSPQDIDFINLRSGSYQGYYKSPEAAKQMAARIVAYMDSVRLLHNGKYDQLSLIGRARYTMFIRIGISPPTDWTFLDPTVSPP